MSIRSSGPTGVASRRARAWVIPLFCALSATCQLACQTGLELPTAPDKAGSGGTAPQAGMGGEAPDAGDPRPDAMVKPDSAVPADAGDDEDAMVGDAEITGCGDGKLQSGEACDDKNANDGDGCSADCARVEQDFLCPAPGQACVSTVACGDGRISGRETCDDGNTRDGDGCDAKCSLVAGYLCVTPGRPCSAAACGDGIIAGDETCDDGAKLAGDGCSASCQLEPGYTCDKPKEPCRKTVCNDGKREGSEPCDDGNQVVGDGCTPFCEVEPDCGAGACKSRCGDGLILPTDDEQCDDGNTLDHDGCSSKCKVEAGFACKLESGELPETLSVPVTYRDFIRKPAANSGATKHPDFEQFSGEGITFNLVAGELDDAGKPVFTDLCGSGKSYTQPVTGCPYKQQNTTKANFDQWYRDVPAVNVTKVKRMELARDAESRAYKIENNAFFPLDADTGTWVAQKKEEASNAHNFGFTSEVRHYFEFKLDTMQPQKLSFSGDDDVWVFINHKLAVDIGGMHSKTNGSVTLDQSKATALGLEDGKIYEIALFHAERHTNESNFNLTLDGFVTAQSHCEAKCGDGVMAGSELCDDGKNDGSYGSCTSDCMRGPHCGDGVVQNPQEQCDDGVNLMTYSATGQPGCAPGCKKSAYCGDGKIDSTAGEECDDADKNSGLYGACGSDCKRGPRCGDKQVQSDRGERCDDGNLLDGDGCDHACQFEGPG